MNEANLPHMGLRGNHSVNHLTGDKKQANFGTFPLAVTLSLQNWSSARHCVCGHAHCEFTMNMWAHPENIKVISCISKFLCISLRRTLSHRYISYAVQVSTHHDMHYVHNVCRTPLFYVRICNFTTRLTMYYIHGQNALRSMQNPERNLTGILFWGPLSSAFIMCEKISFQNHGLLNNEACRSKQYQQQQRQRQ